MDSFSFILFSRPSFIEGIARLVDFTGSLNTYNEMPTGELADQLAMAADYRAVTEDLIKACN